MIQVFNRLRDWFGGRPRNDHAAIAVGEAVATGPLATAATGSPVAAPAPESPEPPTYEDRLRQETGRFATELEIGNLPHIFHYWSNKYLRPELEAFGYQHPEHFFEVELGRIIESNRTRQLRFASLGSGNGDVEVRIAQALLACGHSNFRIDCLELTPEMNQRTVDLAELSGVSAQIRAVQADLNQWNPEHSYDAVIANQSLHHMVELERILDTTKAMLAPGARFLISDMIGRNGHQRWPEALAIVREFWSELPERYRYNLQINRAEPEFLDWDCSTEGFEGIRAQDILPLLCERFEFEVFLPFGNVIDVFIDRSFGHHFQAEADWDRDFIDRVHARDALELRAGTIKPTHIIAVVTAAPPLARRWREGFEPQSCIRRVPGIVSD